MFGSLVQVQSGEPAYKKGNDMKTILSSVILALTLTGCVVTDPYYVRPVPVYVQPTPVYITPNARSHIRCYYTQRPTGYNRQYQTVRICG